VKLSLCFIYYILYLFMIVFEVSWYYILNSAVVERGSRVLRSLCVAYVSSWAGVHTQLH
jgi:hypothetical protein